MRYAQTIFIKVLSGLYQAGFVSKDVKNSLVKSWNQGVKDDDKERNRGLLIELLEQTELEVWRIDLNKAIASLD